MQTFDDLLAGNRGYVEEFAHGHLDVRPLRQLAVITCMDARIDPFRALGLEPGDAHVVRVAGGRFGPQVLHSVHMGISALGVTRIAVIRHTECAASGDDPAADLVADVAALREALASEALGGHDDVLVAGFVYDIRTGALSPEGWSPG